MQVACSIVLLFLTLEPDPVFGLRYNFGDGSYFVGSVDYQGRPSGQGQYHNSSGHLEYDGEFLAGQRHGEGILFNADGSVYRGHFRFDKPNGLGVLQRTNGEVIKGKFRNGQPHGKMEIKMDDKGHKIEGQFRHGMAHGRIKLLDGSKVMFDVTYRMGKPQDLIKIKEEDEQGLIPKELQFSRRLRV